MGYEISKAGQKIVADAFRAVLDAAVPAYEMGQLLLLSDDDERHIRQTVEKMLYAPTLPNGGDRERKYVQYLREMSWPDWWQGTEASREWAEGGEDERRRNVHWLSSRARKALDGWMEVLPPCMCNGQGCPNCWKRSGCYYFRHPMTTKDDKTGFAWLNELKSVATITGEWEVEWFAKLLLEGAPEVVSDFVVEPLFGVRRWDGGVARLIRLRNVRGEVSKVLTMEAEHFGAPEKFRIWGLSKGNFSWSGNQKHVQDLHRDTNVQLAWRIMEEVDACGWHAIEEDELKEMQTGIWFFDDCAYYNSGDAGVAPTRLEADEDGIYRVGEQGYYLKEMGRESEFLQFRPKMKPDCKLSDCDLKIEEWVNQPQGKGEEALYRAFFREVCLKFEETLGGYEGYLLVGLMLSYAGAPEFFKQNGNFPGGFLHGEMQSGKTLVTEWGMSLCGFNVSAGTGKKATAVGILQQAQNYSNLPVWVDEFRPETRDDIIGVLRDAYNRQTSPKWSADGMSRKIRTSFIVSGECTSSDAATRSRYTHIQVSAKRRRANHLAWFTHQKKHLFFFFRYVMERRAAFVSHMRAQLTRWLKFPELAGIGERDKIVHGVHWAAWMAMCHLLESHEMEMESFTKFAMEHTQRAFSDVRSETNVNVFWSDLVTAYMADAIPVSCFRVRSTRAQYPSGYYWISYELLIEPDSTLSALQAFLVKRHGSITLRRKDLRDQLSKEDYWIQNDNSENNLKVKFGPNGSMVTRQAWGIRLDVHPMGLQKITTEELQGSIAKDLLKEQKYADIGPRFENGDPRKGPLFAIVEGVEHHEQSVS